MMRIAILLQKEINDKKIRKKCSDSFRKIELDHSKVKQDLHQKFPGQKAPRRIELIVFI